MKNLIKSVDKNFDGLLKQLTKTKRMREFIDKQDNEINELTAELEATKMSRDEKDEN